MPRVDVIVAPTRFISGQKRAHGELAGDRRPPAGQQRAEHRGEDRVVVVQRQRRPHDVVGRPLPARGDLAATRPRGSCGSACSPSTGRSCRRCTTKVPRSLRANVDVGHRRCRRRAAPPTCRYGSPTARRPTSRRRWRSRRPRRRARGAAPAARPAITAARPARLRCDDQHRRTAVVQLVAQVLTACTRC